MRGHKFQIRAAMRDGHSPSKSVRIAGEMRKLSASRRSDGAGEEHEQGPEPEMELGDPESDDMDTMAGGGVTCAHGHMARGGMCDQGHPAMARGGVQMRHGHQTMESRERMSKSKFGLPEKAPGKGSYPMGDRAHAATAERYASRFASPSEKARIDEKAHRLYPALGKR